eukprot:jgi/Undpi1/11070/HiC_scaffold_30.g13368.m1
MSDNDDDTWEAAARAALHIHRRVASAMRDRDKTGTARRRKVRSSKATTSGSRSNGKTRPMSAPAGGGGFRCRSSCNHRHRTPLMLIPSLEGIPTSSMSLAELEAYATLPRRSNFNGESSLGASSKRSTLLGKSRSAGVIDGARCPRNSSSSLLDGNHYYDKKLMTPTRRDIITAGQQEKSSKIPPQVDALFDRLERLGPTSTTYTQPQLEPHGPASSATLTRSTMATANSRRAVDDAHIAAARHRQGSGGGGSGGGRARVKDLDGCRAALAEHLAARKRENELGRSDVSIRFLREHARKTTNEDNTFVRALRAEVKAMEDIQLESIQRANQRCRDIGAGFSYLPHRVKGKLHVLKMVNDIGRAALSGEHETRAGSRATEPLECYGKVLSVESFMKEDVPRLKKEPSQSRSGAAGENNKTRPTSATLKGQQKKGEQYGKVITQGQPTAADTCRDLHQLIRDTAGLVEMLTRQAAELEGQGWNREPGSNQIAQR